MVSNVFHIHVSLTSKPKQGGSRIKSHVAPLHKISEPEEQLLLIDLLVSSSVTEAYNGINKGSTVHP